jgi:GPH family glycoside/pentoside/hexuronide:cation symporter
MGITAVQILTQLYLLEYYTQVVGLNASLSGIAMAISVFWDAVSDPLMGVVSDRTKSRWGRRRPYIYLGALFLGLSVGFLFAPPQISEQIALFLYLLSTYILVNTAMTVLSVPHLALGGELSNLPEDRTELFGWRLFFSNIGVLFGMIVPAVLIQTMGDESNSETLSLAREVSAWAIGGLVVLTGCFTGWITGREGSGSNHSGYSDSELPLAERASSENPVGSFFRSFLQVLKNPVFLPLFLAFVIATFGRTFNTAVAFFYYKFRLGLKESEVVLGILIPFFVIIILSIPVWVWLAGKFGKKKPAFWGIMALGLLTIVAYPLYPAGNPYFPLITAVFGGICAGSIFLLDSLVADIVDYDYLKTGEGKEGLYFGFWKMGTKLAQAFGLAVSGILLDWIGFQQGKTTQSAEVAWRLALIFGPGVGIFFVLGAGIFYFMPLTPALHTRIQGLLAKRLKIRDQRSRNPGS